MDDILSFSFLILRRWIFNLMVAVKLSKWVSDTSFEVSAINYVPLYNLNFFCFLFPFFCKEIITVTTSSRDEFLPRTKAPRLKKVKKLETSFHFLYVSDWNQSKWNVDILLSENWNRLMKKISEKRRLQRTRQSST